MTMRKTIQEMISHLESIKEDLEYGASLEELPTHNFIKSSVELDMMATRLLKISEQVSEQLTIKD